MPTKDITGKRLSGSGQRRQASERQRARDAAAAAGLVVDTGPGWRPAAAPATQPMECPAPPWGRGVDALVAWAARRQAQAALLAAQGRDPARVRAVGVVVRSIARLKHAAGDSERACLALLRYRGEEVHYQGEDPPENDVGLCAWAIWRLAVLLQETCQGAELEEAEVSHRARALALLEQVQPQAAIDAVAEELQGDADAEG